MNKPFLLSPAAKDYLWGGSRLNDEFSKEIDMYPLAETWECSTHPDGPAVIRSGEYKGRLLTEVIKERPDYLGTRNAHIGDLPIMIKFIDAKEDLSVQVHPDDEYAIEHEGAERGKTEMWYILDCNKDSRLIYGLNKNMSRAEVCKALANGNFERYLQKVKIEKDDIFLINAGTIHGIGKGALIAEIQENSNLTYRLYDYDRVDKNGQKRELHIDKALDVANLKAEREPRQPVRVLKYRPGIASELLCRCKYFEVFRMLINTERRQTVEYRADELSFRVLLCTSGYGNMHYDNETLEIYKGDCIFVPADSENICIHGQMQLLDIRG